ncbi:MAG: glycosyltransferase family 4 protein [Kiritimatiellae bacterium]|nr:glycosyltransferase family 4 protein [Kiritimatiellia bacterium]
MKIVQLVPAMEQGGVERGVVEMNRAIVAQGWDNLVVAKNGRLLDQIERDGGRVARLDVKSKNPLTALWRARELRKLLERERPDVVNVHSRVPAWLFVIANRKLRLPWISFAHGANSVSAYSKVMTFGTVTVTPSRYIADYLKAAYGLEEEKIRVIPRAIDRDKFDPARLDREFTEEMKLKWRTEGRKVVMGVGRITQLKGYDTLIRATAILKKSMPSIRTVIVGEAEALRKDVEEGLKALVQELRLEDTVVFAGNQQKVAECLSLADVVVSANTKKPEAFGRSMAEALAMNKPVVATAFGGALDIVENGKNGMLVPVESAGPEGFAQAIKTVLETEYGDLRTPAIEKFSFANMIKKGLETYESLVLGKV